MNSWRAWGGEDNFPLFFIILDTLLSPRYIVSLSVRVVVCVIHAYHSSRPVARVRGITSRVVKYIASCSRSMVFNVDGV